MDAAVTFECATAIERDMKELGVYDFYYRLVHPLIPTLIEMQMRGVRLDQKVRVKAIEEYSKETKDLQEKLNEAMGRQVDVMSPKQLRELLYSELNLPVQYKRGTTKVTTDEEALQRLASKFDSPVFNFILRIRGNNKLIGTYLNDEGKPDGRMRCSYIIGGTETGRLSSRESVFGTGTNLQNVPPGVCRKMFIPDDGMLLMEPDLSQAEARVVAYLAEEERMIEVFESGGDIHQLTADTLPPDFVPSGSAYKNVDNPRRLFAKKHVHAFHYGEGMLAFARRAGISKQMAEMIRSRYLDGFPRIKAWQLGIQASLSRSRTITTPLGRKRTFFGLWGDGLFREAYAYVPQSTVVDTLNLAMIELKRKYPEVQLMLQNHDAFVIQGKVEEKEMWIERIREVFHIPIYIKGRTLIIPVEIKVGKNWGEMEEVE